MKMSVRRLEDYDINHAIPEYLDKIATAIKSEQGAIEEYDNILDASDIPDELVDTIKEIQNDEKDHMILLSEIMERYSKSDFPDNTDEISELPYPDEDSDYIDL